MIGFMGAGKSTVGKILAEKLDRRFFDLDQLIEKDLGYSIEKIFSLSGEEYFRDLETKLLLDFARADGKFILSTGGGVVLRSGNYDVMKNSGVTVYLEAQLETIWQRIKGNDKRPLLKVDNPLKKAEDLLVQRSSLYKEADYIVKTDNLSPEDIADKVILLVLD